MAAPTPPPSRRTSRPLAVGIVGGLLFFALASLWSLSTPLMSAPDEPAQTVKAVSVAEGNLRGVDRETTIAAPPWVDGTDTTFTIDAGYADLGYLNACYVDEPIQPAGCAPEPRDLPGTATATTYVGTYPPLYYALVGWPSRVFAPDVGLWLMRVCSAAVGGVLVGLALVGARRTEGGGVVLTGVLVALTPMAVYLSSVINPSGMEALAALALWTSALALVRPAGATTRGDVVRAALAFCLLAGIRGFSPVLALGVVACVALMALRRSDLGRLRRAPLVAPVGAVVAVVWAVSVAYVLWSKAYAAVSGVRIEGLTLGTALRTSFSKLGWRTRQAVGDFGYLEAPSPTPLLVLWGVLAGGLAAVALVAGTWRRRLVLVALVATTVAFSTVPEAINAHKVGYIWQGRYSLPVAVGIPVLAAWCLGAASWWRDRWSTRLLVPVALAWVAGQAVGHATALRRFAVGVDHPLFSFLERTAWQPPLRTWSLFGLAVLAAALFAGWVVWVGRPAATAAGPTAGAPEEPDDRQADTTRSTSESSLAPNASTP